VLIDGFTLGAQVLNFLVLVWLLRRFLYGPITRAMTERQRGIDDQLADAARLRDEGLAEGERLRAETARFAAEREELGQRLREELDDHRRTQLARARAEIDELQARWREAVAREREGFLLELRQRAGQQAVEVARRALRDLADEPLEARVIARFLARLDTLGPEERRTLVAGAASDGGRVHVRTAFEVAPALRDQLGAAVTETLGPGHELRFEVVPTLLGGVELRAGGQAVAWTFDEYLATLDAAVADALGRSSDAEIEGGAARAPGRR
jgi:F-type H+-transporting ATPase subunit b